MPESDAAATSLPFLVIEEEAEERDSMGRLFRRDDAAVVLRNIPLDTLRASLRPIVAALRSLFEELADGSSGVQLREAQVGIEVSASGGIQLVGTAQIGAKGAITLVFRQD
jgi:hypothetical protein